MKLEGWIAIDKRTEDWVADSDERTLLEAMDKQKGRWSYLDWQDPVPCTITIPHDGEEVE